MNSETILRALAGGVLIGTAAGGLCWLTGRIAGISGITYGVVKPVPGETLWRLVFLAGMVAAGWGASQMAPGSFAFALDRSTIAIVSAGLLVGFGARLGGGCTSGHGVCGIGRLSLRSTVGTVAFMVAGALTVLVVQRALGGAL